MLMTRQPNPTEISNSSPDVIEVGQRLHELRATRRLSLRALAEQSGLNVNTLSLIENQRTSPSVSTLQQLAQTLQVPITAFFETDHGDKKVVHQKSGERPRAAFMHGYHGGPGSRDVAFWRRTINCHPGTESGQRENSHCSYRA